MASKILFLILFVMVLAGCTAVPDIDLATAVPTRTPAPPVEATAVPTAVLTPTPPPPSPTAVPATDVLAAPTNLPTDTAVSPTAAPISFGQPFWLRGRQTNGTAALSGGEQINDAAFLPGGEQVAIGWANGVSLVNVADLAEKWRVDFDAPLIALTVHPQGTAVAAALGDGTIQVMDAVTGEVQQFTGTRPYAYWGDVAWSPDGRTIAYQFIGPNRGDPIYLLNVADGTVTEVPGTRLDVGTRPYLVWSPDSQNLTLPSLDETCGRIVNATTGETFLPLSSSDGCYEPYAVAWSPDGRYLALDHPRDGGVHVLDATTFEVTHRLQGHPLNYGPIETGDPLTFSEDGRTLCSKGGLDFYGVVYPFKVWDMTTAELVGQLGEDGTAMDIEGEDPHRMAIVCDGHMVTSLFRHGALTRWSPNSGADEGVEEIQSRIPLIAPAYSFVWSADGRKIAAPNRYGGTAVWDVASAELDAHFAEGQGIPALSGDGRLIALIDGENGGIALYDLESDQLLSHLPEATNLPGGAFSPDGSLLAYGSRHQVMLANLITGEVTAVLDGHPVDSLISRVIWSPDGSALVTAGARGEPGELILWERQGDGDYREAYRTQSVRAGYDCCVQLALFNPSGNLVAMEILPGHEAEQFKIVVYDRETAGVLRTISEYQLAAWMSDDILLTSEAQYDTLLTQWQVYTGEKTIGFGRELGGNVYAPGGLFYANYSGSGPDFGRSIDVNQWQSLQVVARLTHGSDIAQISWSPDGRYLASLAGDGTIRVWSVSYP